MNRYSNEKLVEILRSAGDQNPLLIALEQIIGDQLESETTSAILSDLDPHGRAYNCGRAASIKDLQLYITALKSEIVDN
jgi:hypothetical protein